MQNTNTTVKEFGSHLPKVITKIKVAHFCGPQCVFIINVYTSRKQTLHSDVTDLQAISEGSYLLRSFHQVRCQTRYHLLHVMRRGLGYI